MKIAEYVENEEREQWEEVIIEEEVGELEGHESEAWEIMSDGQKKRKTKLVKKKKRKIKTEDTLKEKKKKDVNLNVLTR